MRSALAVPFLLATALAAPASGARPGGTPNEEKTPMEKILIVGPERKPCVGVGPMECLQVKEKEDAPWTLFYEPIAGFTHEKGYECTLRVRVIPVANPPADASRLRYTLLEVLRRTAVATPSGGSAIEGPTWRLRSLGERDEEALAAARRGFSARFAGGRVEGSSGCNQYTGGYTLGGDRLSLGPLAGTRMACPETVMALEQHFLAAFRGTLVVAIDGDRLTLSPASGPPLVFEREPPPVLEGVDWEVMSYNNGRQAVVSVLGGTALHLRFEGGTVSGHAGCSPFRAAYTASGEALAVSDPAATRKACPGEGLMEQEQRFLEALRSVGRWTVREGRLELRRADGALAVSARRPD